MIPLKAMKARPLVNNIRNLEMVHILMIYVGLLPELRQVSNVLHTVDFQTVISPIHQRGGQSKAKRRLTEAVAVLDVCKQSVIAAIQELLWADLHDDVPSVLV